MCSRNLSELGTASEQEAHVRSCLEGDTSKSPQIARYLVYKLPAESALIGIECTFPVDSPCVSEVTHTSIVGVICLEEFVVGSTVARLSCLCSFHNSMFPSASSPEKKTLTHMQTACPLGCNAVKAALSMLAIPRCPSNPYLDYTCFILLWNNEWMTQNDTNARS